MTDEECLLIEDLAECIKSLACMIYSDGEEFIAERLRQVHSRASAVQDVLRRRGVQ